MSEAERPSGEPERPSGRPTPEGRRRGRLLVPGVIVAAILTVFAFILLVSQCGTGDESSVYGQAGGVPPAVDAPAAAAAP